MRLLIGWKPKVRSPRVASARLRCLEPLALLRAGRRPVECFHSGHVGRYGVLVLQKLYDREHRELAERVRKQGGRVVLDLCDHPFYNPTGNARYAADARNLEAFLPFADLVTASTQELARVIAERHAGPIRVVPDSVGLPGWKARWWRLFPPRRAAGTLEIVWYGLAGSGRAAGGMRDLLQIRDELEDLSRDFPLRLTVISNSRRAFEEAICGFPFPTRYLKWRSHDRLCAAMPHFDLCVLPVSQNPYTYCKSNNRLALALALGVPVVADSLPSYRELAPYCVLDDWPGGLRAYAASAQKRREDATAGQEYVNRQYGAECVAARWWNVFAPLLETAETNRGRRGSRPVGGNALDSASGK